MRRGFKADAERRAAQVRAELGLEGHAPLCPWKFAGHLNIVVFEITSLPLDASDLEQLIKTDSSSWSGFTVEEAGLKGIVLNSSHSPGRRASTLMHELSHHVLRHVPARVDIFTETGMLILSDFSQEQEDEANWLSGCLLAPRIALTRLRSQGKTVPEIAEVLGISDEMSRWRVRMTGIDSQFKYARR